MGEATRFIPRLYKPRLIGPKTRPIMTESKLLMPQLVKLLARILDPKANIPFASAFRVGIQEWRTYKLTTIEYIIACTTCATTNAHTPAPAKANGSPTNRYPKR